MIAALAAALSFDVLVIGSGASGLAAKGSLQSCNSAKAQGGIQAAFGEDDSPEVHAEDVWKSSHETADRRLVTVLTSGAPTAIHWLEELGIGLAAAVLIDATIVRAVLLPATMKLLGDRNWYLPTWLGWLPRLEPHAEPAPSAA